MNSVVIMTDSCSDLGKEIRERFNIEYVRMNTVKQGVETSASLDWEYYSPTELYDTMRAGERVTTTQVPIEEFRRGFTEVLERGSDIVYIGCSLKQSGSVNTGETVAKELAEKYPDRTIICIDSLNACMGEGALVIRAAGYRDAGLSAKEIAEKIMAERNNINEFVTVHSLDALKRAGRVKGSAAFFGNLLGVKPIIISDANGEQTPVKKVKGREGSLREIVSMLKEATEGYDNDIIYVAHADCREDADFVADLIRQEIPCKEVYVDYIGPIIGASIGPGAVGIFGYGREVTYTV